MDQPSQTVLRWAAMMKQRGHEVRLTKNGRPYALIQRSVKKLVPREKRSHLKVVANKARA